MDENTAWSFKLSRRTSSLYSAGEQPKEWDSSPSTTETSDNYSPSRRNAKPLRMSSNLYSTRNPRLPEWSCYSEDGRCNKADEVPSTPCSNRDTDQTSIRVGPTCRSQRHHSCNETNRMVFSNISADEEECKTSYLY